ncbi:uncharacterized protein LOC134272674 [Saccostrea cucullata]|uniref:uncharacterized protein LOC134272674 n=1 Tax=Saccostrea cuccullata TaxID=36930 RepID=UPI002ED55854
MTQTGEVHLLLKMKSIPCIASGKHPIIQDFQTWMRTSSHHLYEQQQTNNISAVGKDVYFGCLATRYGEDCERPCSHNCINGTCHANNGTCTLGCDGNYFDAKCQNALYDGSYISNSKQAIYIGSVTGVVGSLLVVMVLIHFFRSRKRENIYSTSGVAYKENNYDQLIFKIPVEVDRREKNKPQARNPNEEVYENNL